MANILCVYVCNPEHFPFVCNTTCSDTYWDNNLKQSCPLFGEQRFNTDADCQQYAHNNFTDDNRPALLCKYYCNNTDMYPNHCVSAPGICPQIWYQCSLWEEPQIYSTLNNCDEGNKYKIVNQGKNWTEAQAYCYMTYGTYLAEIETNEQINAINELCQIHGVSKVWVQTKACNLNGTHPMLCGDNKSNNIPERCSYIGPNYDGINNAHCGMKLSFLCNYLITDGNISSNQTSQATNTQQQSIDIIVTTQQPKEQNMIIILAVFLAVIVLVCIVLLIWCGKKNKKARMELNNQMNEPSSTQPTIELSGAENSHLYSNEQDMNLSTPPPNAGDGSGNCNENDVLVPVLSKHASDHQIN